MAQASSIQLPCLPFDVAFHPSQPLVSIGLISGSVELDSYRRTSEGQEGGEQEGASAAQAQEPQRLWRKKAHKQSCRAVAFVDNGNSLLSASSDQSLVLRDTDTGKRTWAQPNAHQSAINRLAGLSENTVASGDDSGAIKIWDVRQPSCCATMSVHEDFIADMHHATEKQKLLAVSGDGTMLVFDLRQNRKEARSEYAEDELLSITVVKNGRKVVCGSQEGVLLLYSWGYFNDCSDRFPGHPQSIDALLKLDEDSVITGSQDGLIRVISILPNRFEGVIGQHMDCPIERLALSGDGFTLASASHDNLIRLWDLSALGGSEDEGEEEEGEGKEGEEVEAGEKAEGREGEEERSGGTVGRGEPEKGSMDEGRKRRRRKDDSGDSDSDFEEEKASKRKGSKQERKKKGKAGKGHSGRKNSFYADL